MATRRLDSVLRAAPIPLRRAALRVRALAVAIALAPLWTCAVPCASEQIASTPLAPRARFPLHVSADGQQLEDRDGRPFLIVGDAAWSLMVALTKDETATYLQNRAAKGFNTILVNLIEHKFGGPANRDGELPFVSGTDFSTPNEAYFAHVDWVLDEAAANGILVLLAPAYLGLLCGDQGWCQEMLDQPVAHMTAYGDFLGARYASRTNVLWVHGGDAHDDRVDSRVDAIANAIQARAPRHLHTAHCSRGRSALDCYDQPWLDVNSTYSRCDTTASEVHNDYERAHIPSFVIEARYENYESTADWTPECLLTQEYAAVLGGSQGDVFGNKPIWPFLPGWETELDGSGSLAMSHAANLFASRNRAGLVPDYDERVVTAGRGHLDDASYAPAALTADGGQLIAYVPTSRTLTVDLSKMSGASVAAWSFDPRDGSSTLLGHFRTTGPHEFELSGPGVLVADDDALHLAAPGTRRFAPEPGPALLGGAALATLRGLARRRRRRRRSE